MTTDQNTSKDSNEKVEKTSKGLKQNPENLIDEAFYVEQKKYGLWYSYDKEGKSLITSLTEEICVRATRFYLKGLQEGWSDANITYDGTVGGNL